MLIIEHIRLAEPVMQLAAITRDEKERGTAAPFETEKGMKISGRFADILDRSRFA